MNTFYKALLKNPCSIGAVAPSSSHLSHVIASFIPKVTGKVLELGAGTGPITDAILRHGISPSQLIAFEKSEELSELLRERFPDIQVINGDANHLRKTLGKLSEEVEIIVSALPLFSLPRVDRENIVKEIEKIMRPGSYYLQYSYRRCMFEENPSFKKINTQRIWLNLPPARVDLYKVVEAKDPKQDPR